MSKMSKPTRRHHFVPVSLLKNFASDEKTIWLFDAKKKVISKQIPDTVGYQKDWHAIIKKGGQKDTDAIERIVTDRYDTPGAPAIQRLLKRETLSTESRIAFLRLVASLMMRTPRAIGQQREMHTSILNAAASRLAAHDAEFRGNVTKRLKDAGASTEIIALILEDIASQRTSMTPSHGFTLLTCLKQIEAISIELAELDWKFCTLHDADPNLLVGDHPVLLADIGPDSWQRRLGLRNPYIELIVPLGKRMAAVGNRSGKTAYCTFEPNMAQMINRRMLQWADRFVYYGEHSEKLLSEFVTLHGTGPKLHISEVVDGSGLRTVFEQY